MVAEEVEEQRHTVLSRAFTGRYEPTRAAVTKYWRSLT